MVRLPEGHAAEAGAAAGDAGAEVSCRVIVGMLRLRVQVVSGSVCWWIKRPPSHLVFGEKLEEEINLGNLMLQATTGAILFSTVLEKAEKGTQVPHICSLCFSKSGRTKLLVNSSETF